MIHTDVQLEAVLNLQDVIEYHDESGVIQEYALMAVAAGAEEKLKRLLLSDDVEVKGSAEEVLAALDRAKLAKDAGGTAVAPAAPVAAPALAAGVPAAAGAAA